MKLVHPLLNAYVKRCNAIKLNAKDDFTNRICYDYFQHKCNETFHSNSVVSQKKFTYFPSIFKNAVETFFIDFTCVVIKADEREEETGFKWIHHVPTPPLL